MLPLLTLLLATACTTKSAAPLSAEAERGKAAYQTNCTACHNADPAKVGPVGPAVAGASRALVEARVVRAEYPEDYKPIRDTHLMPALPQLAGSVDDLTAFLASTPR